MMQHGAFSSRWTPPSVTVLRIIMTAVLLGSGIVRPVGVQAQSDLGWSTHEILYDGMVRSHVTSLVSDPFGAAHMVWKLADEETYFYSQWDGTTWTAPIDIVATTADVGLAPPALVAAADGSLHLFWARDCIMHTWAWSDAAASSARAWSQPEPTVFPAESARDALDAKQDRFGMVHLVFSAGDDVYYVRADAEGLDWTNPSVLRRAESATRMSAPRLDISPDGRIHVTWEEWPLYGDPAESSRLYYAQSADDGSSWSYPRQLGELANRNSNILAAADGTVYLAWQAGIFSPDVGRFVQRSTDNGETWEVPVKFSSLSGQSGYPGLALDSQGRLHIITGDGEYAFWDGTSISTPLDLRPVPEQTENAQLGIVSGNQVLVVMGPFHGPGLHYAVKDLPLPAAPTLAAPDHPSTLATPSLAAAAEGTVSAAAPTTSAVLRNGSALPSNRPHSSAGSILVLSGGLALALTAVVLIVHFGRRRR